MVGFVYMSEINLFCLFNKVPGLTTAMDWFVVCSVHDRAYSKYFPISFIFKCIYAFLHVFVQGPRFKSMWQLKICTFIMRCFFCYLSPSIVSPCL